MLVISDRFHWKINLIIELKKTEGKRPWYGIGPHKIRKVAYDYLYRNANSYLVVYSQTRRGVTSHHTRIQISERILPLGLNSRELLILMENKNAD